MGMWQPIDTAPKDGTPIKVKTPDGETRAAWGKHPTTNNDKAWMDDINLDWGMSWTHKLTPQPTQWKGVNK